MSVTYADIPIRQEQTSTIGYHEYQQWVTQSRWLRQFADKWTKVEQSKIAEPYWQTETKAFTTFDTVSARQFLVSLSEYQNLPALDFSQKYMALLVRWTEATQTSRFWRFLRATAVELFSSTQEVDAIYHDALDSEIVFWVFVDNEEYDDKLMDLLISYEEKLLDTFPETPIMVRFVPSILCDSYEEVVGNSAQLIFKR